MQISQIGEFGLIQQIRSICTKKTSRGVLKGIGDDAAVLKTGGKTLLVTSDMLIERIHFDLSLTTFYQLGHKFLAVNVSDIHAMGGKPGYFLVSLGIPSSCSAQEIEELYSGIAESADRYGVSIIGGDTCASKKDLVLNGTLIGTSGKSIITRSGAAEGNEIYVTATLGDSAMGLKLLKKRRRRVRSFSSESPGLKLIRKHLMPEPAPLDVSGHITSMIDLSDGLLIDLGHICDESGVGALLYRDRIPLSAELVSTAKKFRTSTLDLALKGGEDYALLFTAPPDIKTDAFRIGEIIRKGRFIADAKGRKTPFKAEGYEHFR